MTQHGSKAEKRQSDRNRNAYGGGRWGKGWGGREREKQDSEGRGLGAGSEGHSSTHAGLKHAVLGMGEPRGEFRHPEQGDRQSEEECGGGPREYVRLPFTQDKLSSACLFSWDGGQDTYPP